MTDKISMHFLSEDRRLKLIADLQALSMPHALAVDYASFRDDLGLIDKSLAVIATGIGNYCEIISQAIKHHNQEQCANYRVFLAASSTMLASYLQEAEARQLSGQLPRFVRASRKSMTASSECKAVILRAMGHTGTIQ